MWPPPARYQWRPRCARWRAAVYTHPRRRELAGKFGRRRSVPAHVMVTDLNSAESDKRWFHATVQSRQPRESACRTLPSLARVNERQVFEGMPTHTVPLVCRFRAGHDRRHRDGRHLQWRGAATTTPSSMFDTSCAPHACVFHHAPPLPCQAWLCLCTALQIPTTSGRHDVREAVHVYSC